jgi:ATPase subunit of ABC transporter with duplicated ATPase domains
MDSKTLLYDWIQSSKNTVIIVSHDRTLLNLLDDMAEMTPNGIKRYGGNYTFYEAQKRPSAMRYNKIFHHKERAIKIAKEKERETIERQKRLNNRGQKSREGRCSAHHDEYTCNNAEKSTAKIKMCIRTKLEISNPIYRNSEVHNLHWMKLK